MFINPRHDKEMPMNGFLLPETRIIRPAKIVVPYYTLGTEDVAWEEGYDSHTGETTITEFTKEADHLYMRADVTGGVGGNASEIAGVTSGLIDLTGIDTLKVDWANVGTVSANNQSYLIVSTSKAGSQATYDARIAATGVITRQVASLDVSTLSGSYYIRTHARNAAFVNSRLRVYKVWGEA